jgi:hypothetical protein
VVRLVCAPDRGRRPAPNAWDILLRRDDITLDVRGFSWLTTVAINEALKLLHRTRGETPVGTFQAQACGHDDDLERRTNSRRRRQPGPVARSTLDQQSGATGRDVKLVPRFRGGITRGKLEVGARVRRRATP